MVSYFNILLLFIFSYVPTQEHVLIGDSQTQFIAKHTQKIQRASGLCIGGIGVNELTVRINHKKVNPNVKSVFISIGVNDGYVDKGITSMITSIRRIYPNAKLYVIQGSWGWGRVRNKKLQHLQKYYQTFVSQGCKLISTPIGYGDPHQDKKSYRKIATECEQEILTKN